MIINYSDEKVKKDQKSNNNQNGVITIMLRDAAMTASEKPYSLDEFEIDIINENEISIKK